MRQRFFRLILLTAFIFPLTLGLTACEKQGKMEEMGERADDALDKASEEMEKLSDELKKKAKEAKDKLDD